MQSARRSAIPSRCSIAASSNIPASEVIRPPSKVKCTGLPATGGKPGRIPVPSSMAAQTPLASIGPALASESYVEPIGYVAPASPLRQTDELSRLDAVTAFVQETARPSVPRRSQLIRRPAPPEIRRLVEAKRARDDEATYIDQDEDYLKDEAQLRAGIADREDATAGVVIFDDR